MVSRPLQLFHWVRGHSVYGAIIIYKVDNLIVLQRSLELNDQGL